MVCYGGFTEGNMATADLALWERFMGDGVQPRLCRSVAEVGWVVDDDGFEKHKAQVEVSGDRVKAERICQAIGLFRYSHYIPNYSRLSFQ